MPDKYTTYGLRFPNFQTPWPHKVYLWPHLATLTNRISEEKQAIKKKRFRFFVHFPRLHTLFPTLPNNNFPDELNCDFVVAVDYCDTKLSQSNRIIQIIRAHYLSSQCLKVTRLCKATIRFTPNPNFWDTSYHLARHCPKVTRFWSKDTLSFPQYLNSAMALDYVTAHSLS